jgi:prepilin-type processing-associated H-X9-DG protein
LLCEAGDVLSDVSSTTIDSRPALDQGRSGSTYGNLDLLECSNNLCQPHDNYAYTTHSVGYMATGQLRNRTDYWGAAWKSGEGRHLEQSNYLFADGHVKSLRGDKVSGGFPALNATDAETIRPSASASGRAEGTEVNGVAATFSPI